MQQGPIFIFSLVSVVLACTKQYQFTFKLNSFEAIPHNSARTLHLVFRAHVIGFLGEILFDNRKDSNTLRSGTSTSFNHTYNPNDENLKLMIQFLEMSTYHLIDISKSPTVRAILERAALGEHQGTQPDGSGFECVFQSTHPIQLTQTMNEVRNGSIPSAEFNASKCSNRVTNIKYNISFTVIRKACTTTSTMATTVSNAAAPSTSEMTPTEKQCTTTPMSSSDATTAIWNTSAMTAATTTTTDTSTDTAPSSVQKPFDSIIKLEISEPVENDDLIDTDRQSVKRVCMGLFVAAQCPECDVGHLGQIHLELRRPLKQRRERQVESPRIEDVIRTFYKRFPEQVTLKSGKTTRIIGKPADVKGSPVDHSTVIVVCVLIVIFVFLLVAGFSLWRFRKLNESSVDERSIQPPQKKMAKVNAMQKTPAELPTDKTSHLLTDPGSKLEPEVKREQQDNNQPSRSETYPSDSWTGERSTIGALTQSPCRVTMNDSSGSTPTTDFINSKQSAFTSKENQVRQTKPSDKLVRVATKEPHQHQRK